MNVTDVRAGFATRLSTITALKIVTATAPDALSQTPAAIVGFPHIIERADFTGVRAEFPIWIITARLGDVERGQDELDGFLALSGASSVVAAIEADSSLGGSVDSVSWLNTDSYGAHYQFGETAFLGATVNFEVYADA